MRLPQRNNPHTWWPCARSIVDEPAGSCSLHRLVCITTPNIYWEQGKFTWKLSVSCTVTQESICISNRDTPYILQFLVSLILSSQFQDRGTHEHRSSKAHGSHQRYKLQSMESQRVIHNWDTHTDTHTHRHTHTQGRCHPGSEGKLEVSLVVEGFQIKPQRQRIADIFF